ncbi:MAG: hypothetical protein ACI31U_11145 [Lactobacillus crispatus]
MLNFYISASQTYNLFRHDDIYSRATFNSILVDNMFSPNGGNAISTDSSLSLVKAFSEACERHALIIPTTNPQKKYVSYDVITNRIKYVSGSKLGYNYQTDTTGTATHLNITSAIKHSIGELIEKNALLRMWYKNDVENISDIGWQPNNQKTIFLLNNFFFPYYVVLAAYKDENQYWHCGLGSSLENVSVAKQAAYKEMNLMWFQNNIDKVNFSLSKKHNKTLYWKWDSKQIQHMDKLSSLNQVKKHHYFPIRDPKNIHELGLLLSCTLKHIYITLITDNLFNKPLLTVRCFSDELISCVVQKSLLVKLLQNSSVNFISVKDLKNKVDCPIV